MVEMYLFNFATEIRRISDVIGKDWKLLAFQLGYQKADIEAIECACPHNQKDQVHTLLDAWRQREGSEVTVGELHRALMAANIRLDNTERKVMYNNNHRAYCNGINNHRA